MSINYNLKKIAYDLHGHTQPTDSQLTHIKSIYDKGLWYKYSKIIIPDYSNNIQLIEFLIHSEHLIQKQIQYKQIELHRKENQDNLTESEKNNMIYMNNEKVIINAIKNIHNKQLQPLRSAEKSKLRSQLRKLYHQLGYNYYHIKCDK